MSITVGATPQCEFKYDFDWESTDILIISFSQKGQIIFEVDKSRLTYNTINKTIIVKLTQEETLKLNDNNILHVQIKVKLTNNNVLLSNIVTANVLPAINHKEI